MARKSTAQRTGKVLQVNHVIADAWGDFNAQSAILNDADKRRAALKNDVLLPAFGRFKAIRLPDGRVLEKRTRTVREHTRAESTSTFILEVDQ